MSNFATSPPPNPRAPPTLEEGAGDGILVDKGVFKINLTKAVWDRRQESTHLTGFLFKIHDLTSTNTTYIWQV